MKYDKFQTKFIRVPVQFGKKSKVERKVHVLGYVGSIPSDREIYVWYRIANGWRGAGRFIELHRWKDDADRLWEIMSYVSYNHIPAEVRKKIEAGKSAALNFADMTTTQGMQQREHLMEAYRQKGD